MNLLEIRDLTLAFGTAEPVLDRVSLEIARGEILAVVGESGSGKSLTALAVMGLLPPRASMVSGTIAFDGRDLSRLNPGERRRLRGAAMGMVFQEPMTSLNPVLTVGRQVREALVAHNALPRREAETRALAMLERVGLGRDPALLKRYPHELSGGMRQRVMIAMAMVLQPALLIADEPTTALDVTVQAQVLDLLRALVRETGTSLLLITHDMGVVASIADRVAVMQRGRVVETRPATALFATPAQPYTRSLLAAVPRLDGPGRVLPPGEPMPALRAERIGKRFGARPLFRRRPAGTTAVQDVSLDLHPGETLALVGESGSGKSTLGRAIARLVEVDQGRILLGETDLTRVSGRALRRQRSAIQLIFQDPFASLDPRFTLLATVAEPMIVAGKDRRTANDRALGLMERVGLPKTLADRLPHELSGGQRQRVAIARALAAEPKIIVADEPTSALDVSVQAQVLALLAELQEEHGLAYLFITHDLAVVRRIAHRVAVMRQGRVVELGPTDAVMRAAHHPYTRALLAAVPQPDPGVRPALQMPVFPNEGTALREIAAGHWVLQ